MVVDDATNFHVPSGYARQDLSEDMTKYIRVEVLEKFVKLRPREFGTRWTRHVDDTSHQIVLVAKRPLTKDEIKTIQDESYPKRKKANLFA